MRPPPSPSARPEADRELLDGDDLDVRAQQAALGELRRVNRWLLGHRSVHRTLLGRLASGPAEQRLLDIGAGGGEVAEGLVRRARVAGRRVRLIGLDRKLGHLLAGGARRRSQLRVVADARHLPLRDGAVDWSLSTLFFHHLDEDGNRRVLAEMRRVARRGAAVVDLRSSPLARRLGPLLIAGLGVGRVTRHDGRLSLARAWSLAAVAGLVAGQPVEELRRRFPFRFSLVLAGGGGASRPAVLPTHQPPAAAELRP
ncbi:MAG TPA: methyltransferase domain-containing protein [Thermoanaerobaculia bacterium]|nr:methyltransferase domain-containing protein [Thermoanaerobaculia bacterium]